MVRVLNFVCVALMGMTILALYHVSEQTRVERVQLSRVEQRILDERLQMSVLQTQWEQVSQPERIQKIAEAALGMGDAATIQLSSLELLPRRGEEAPLWRGADSHGERASSGADAAGAARQGRRSTGDVGRR